MPRKGAVSSPQRPKKGSCSCCDQLTSLSLTFQSAESTTWTLLQSFLMSAHLLSLSWQQHLREWAHSSWHKRLSTQDVPERGRLESNERGGGEEKSERGMTSIEGGRGEGYVCACVWNAVHNRLDYNLVLPVEKRQTILVGACGNVDNL